MWASLATPCGLGLPIVETLGDHYWGDRTFTFEDHGGHRWTMAQNIPGFEVELSTGHRFAEDKTPSLV